ncbi:hypothetical protein KCU85_g2045, partial [Aureobasidium melanogenum]
MALDSNLLGPFDTESTSSGSPSEDTVNPTPSKQNRRTYAHCLALIRNGALLIFNGKLKLISYAFSENFAKINCTGQINDALNGNFAKINCTGHAEVQPGQLCDAFSEDFAKINCTAQLRSTAPVTLEPSLINSSVRSAMPSARTSPGSTALVTLKSNLANSAMSLVEASQESVAPSKPKSCSHSTRTRTYLITT